MSVATHDHGHHAPPGHSAHRHARMVRHQPRRGYSESASVTRMSRMQTTGWQASGVAESPSTAPQPPYARLVVAGTVAVLFACALIAEAVVISLVAVTNHGT